MRDQYRANLKELYYMNLPTKVDITQVKAESDFDGNPIYNFRDLKFTLNQEQIVKLLMGTSLYGNSSVAIRELIQNAVDTCNVRKLHESVWEREYRPRIDIRIMKKDNNSYMEVEDNGMGMDEYIINKYFSKAGNSFYRSEDFYKIIAEIGKDYNPISKFGIGILSVFMIADSIEVETRRVIDRYDCTEPIKLIIEGTNSFFWYTKCSKKNPGTKIKILLKPNYINSLKDIKSKVIELTKYIEIPIYFNNELILEEEKENVNEKWDRYSSDYDGISLYNIDLNMQEGIKGSITVALVEKNGRFFDEYEISSDDVDVNGISLIVKQKLLLGNNMIEKASDSIDVNGNSIDTNAGYTALLKSRGKVYVNGIFVDDNIFFDGDRWTRITNNTGKLVLPFPINCTINLFNTFDVNLNAARDKIIYDEKWDYFKINFTKILYNELTLKINKSKIQSFYKVIKKDKTEK